jgi:hypothetical protein
MLERINSWPAIAAGKLTSARIAGRNVFTLVAVFGRDHCACISCLSGVLFVLVCTVNIDLALLHELAELREPLGGVYLRHVDRAECGRGVKGSSGRQRAFDGYMCAPQQAFEHIELMVGSLSLMPRRQLQLREGATRASLAGQAQPTFLSRWQPCQAISLVPRLSRQGT